MPQTRLVADALGVVTIPLVDLLVLIGLFCILYSFYFHSHIRNQGFVQLGYFGGPLIIRIALIFFAIWWCFGEIIRLTFLRFQGRVLSAISPAWQETVCKCYIVSNLGFAEPCLLLTFVFLLRAALQNTELGTLSWKWNCRTAGYILLFCLPIFVVQMIIVIVGPQYENDMNKHKRGYFFKITFWSRMENQNDVALCSYPLLSTIFLGLFYIVLTAYFIWLGRRVLKLVINKGLQKRVYILIFFVSIFFPLRILLLGLSVLSEPVEPLFEVLTFLGFLSILCCAGIGVCMLVYFPIADSLALRNLHDIEARRRIIEEHNDTLALIANQSQSQSPLIINDYMASSSSPGKNSVASSAKRGSISFRAMERDERSEAFVELSLFSPSQNSTPLGSPQLRGWPMLPHGQ